MSDLLPGSFDLHIIDTCNLHCDGCVVLDYLQKGIVTNTRYELDDVKDVMKNLKKLDLRLEELRILGGEPTLHTDLDNIIEYIKGTELVDNLSLITNGLNFTNEVIESIKKLDKLIISVYPFDLDLERELKKSNLWYDLIFNVDVEFWKYKTFELYGHKIPNMEYSEQLNWDRCYQKDSCRVITKDYLYRCTITYSEKKDLCDWTDRQKVISFINSDNPLSHCKDCPTPPYEKKYESNNLPIDLKNFSRGIKLINDYSKV